MPLNKDDLDVYLNTFHSILKKYIDLYYKNYSDFFDEYIKKIGIIDLYERFLLYLNDKKKIEISEYIITKKRIDDKLKLLEFNKDIIGEIYLFIKDVLIKHFNDLMRSPSWGNINIRFPPQN
jgi:hypothetical protein